MKEFENIQAFIEEEKDLLNNHPLYSKIKTLEHLQKFTQVHVFAVWDFMSLLKALQIELTCVTIPWFASEYPNTRYLINEIVLAEESDTFIDGRRLSHFEMYMDSMESMGSNTSYIKDFLTNVKKSNDIFQSIENLDIDIRIKEFLKFTFQIIETKEPHKIAAAFTFGREDLIPHMFSSILKEIQINFPESDLAKFIYYFQRHIELDGDEHGPLALKMIEELAQDDAQKWEEIQIVSKQALKKRLDLWDSINDSIS
ncbi:MULTISPECIES: DUF3050 domain-containing protein [Sphingobacterium]|uniref:DUF3050 domain-containing protein n=1 Tax=Sphingobacterium litopenaei TaxID=2763500 RepID=A0ABR7YFS9_9SPHI|nr:MULTISPECIES: DUF3050 domain-containing protein [Sphingobacterium]MBD1430173.1 DUF3050 domain-containing protein [Sphingobacterium litopenaei]NGM73109.1 DUF3050 domain-containing protein [Sphingobacterium sp. SGL-16]